MLCTPSVPPQYPLSMHPLYASSMCPFVCRLQVLIATDTSNPKIKNWLHKAARRTWLLNATTVRDTHLIGVGVT